MGLADALRDAPKGREYKKQAVDVVLDQLDGEDRDALLDALADPSITAPTIAAALVQNGYLLDTNDPNQRVRDWRARHVKG